MLSLGEGGERRGDLEDDGSFFEGEGGLGGEFVGEGVVPVEEGEGGTADCQLEEEGELEGGSETRKPGEMDWISPWERDFDVEEPQLEKFKLTEVLEEKVSSCGSRKTREERSRGGGRKGSEVSVISPSLPPLHLDLFAFAFSLLPFSTRSQT